MMKKQNHGSHCEEPLLPAAAGSKDDEALTPLAASASGLIRIPLTAPITCRSTGNWDEAISKARLLRPCHRLRRCQGLAMTALLLLQPFVIPGTFSSEIIDDTQTRAIVREHPKTGRPYVSIIPSEAPDPPDPFTGQKGQIIRPDYRLLDPKIKSGEVPYEGPVSDRTKVYIFAASLATLGTVGALALPVAAGTGAASGGAGAYLAGGAAVTAGSAGAWSAAAAPDPKKEDYDHVSEYQLNGTSRHPESRDRSPEGPVPDDADQR